MKCAQFQGVTTQLGGEEGVELARRGTIEGFREDTLRHDTEGLDEVLQESVFVSLPSLLLKCKCGVPLPYPTARRHLPKRKSDHVWCSGTERHLLSGDSIR